MIAAKLAGPCHFPKNTIVIDSLLNYYAALSVHLSIVSEPSATLRTENSEKAKIDHWQEQRTAANKLLAIGSSDFVENLPIKCQLQRTCDV